MIQDARADDGYVGIYADSTGLFPCTAVPPFSGATLYVLATVEGSTSTGITGAEFRIEVPNPSGWFFSYTAPPGATVVIGDPLDVNSASNNAGINIGFGSCEIPSEGLIRLGKISVFNSSGSSTPLLVKRHERPSNAGFSCPLFVQCTVAYSMICMTSSEEAPCEISKQEVLTDESAYFVGALNSPESEDPLVFRDGTREVLAMLSEGLIELPAGAPGAALSGTIIVSEELAMVLAAHEVHTVLRSFPQRQEVAIASQGSEIHFTDRSNVYTFVLPENGNAAELADDLRSLADVVYAHVNGAADDDSPTSSGYRGDHAFKADEHRLADTCNFGTSGCAVAIPDCPDDPGFRGRLQWPLVNTSEYPSGNPGMCNADINIESAWSLTTGSAGVRVAIIAPNGIHPHPDLAGRIIPSEPWENPGHYLSTSLAGIIGANTDNGIYMAGIDRHAMLVARSTQNNDGLDENLVQDIEASILLNARILLNAYVLTEPSSCSPRVSETVNTALRDAYMANRVVIASVGNSEPPCGSSTAYYPAAFEQAVIAVGGTDRDDLHYTGSATGPHLDVSAPGAGLYALNSFFPGTTILNGTEGAAAHVAGIASLLLARHGSLDNDDIRNVLQLSADDLGSEGVDELFGHGRLDAGAALEILEAPNRLFHLEEDGYDDVASWTSRSPHDYIVAPDGLQPGHYEVERYELIRHVTFPVTFQAPPRVWGRGWKTRGASIENPSYSHGWCEPVEGTITTTGCDLRTYVYKVYSCLGFGCNNFEGWFPAALSSSEGQLPKYAFSVLGEVASTDALEYTEQIPAAMRLTVNNPAMRSINFAIRTSTRRFCQLEMYDIAGRHIRTVHRGDIQAGTTEVTCQSADTQGRPLPVGVYIARLVSGAQTSSRKFVLLR